MNLQRPHGLLFYGPSGTGKTSFSQAEAMYIQAELDKKKSGVQVSYYRITGTVESHLRGGTATNIDTMFKAIRNGPIGPKIVFLDEANQFFRRNGTDMQADTAEHFNRGLDSLFETPGVFVAMATNFKDLIPNTTQRRIDKIIKIGLPDEPTRIKIMQSQVESFSPPSKKIPFAADIDFARYARGLRRGIATGDDYKKFFGQLKAELHLLTKEIEDGEAPVIIAVQQKKGKNKGSMEEHILQPLHMPHGSFPRTVQEARTYSLFFSPDGEDQLKDYGLEVPYDLGKDGVYRMTGVKIVQVTNKVFAKVYDAYNAAHPVTDEQYSSAFQD